MLFKNTISSIEFTKTNSIHFPIHSRQSKRFFNATNCCSIYFSVTKMNKSVPSVKQPILTKLQQIDRIPSRIEKVIDQNVYVRLYVFCDPHNMKESMAGHYHRSLWSLWAISSKLSAIRVNIWIRRPNDV